MSRSDSSRDILESLLRLYLKTGDSAPIHRLLQQIESPSPASNVELTEVIGHEDELAALTEVIHHDTDGATDMHTDFERHLASYPNYERALADIGYHKMQTEISASQPEQSKTLAGYRYEHELGKGGMGRVDRVFDVQLNRSIALKQLKKSDPISIHRFEQEAQITAQLEHPNIPPVYELQRFSNGMPYFTMPEINGRTLASLVSEVHQASQDGEWRESSNGWTLHRLIAALHSICETMAYAHARGVAHLDIKPSNIMVGEFGEIFVLDWGIAKVIPAQPGYRPVILKETDAVGMQKGRLYGTPVYMAPEQVLGQDEQIGAQSDIYALGAILYWILSGRSAFLGSPSAIIQHKRTAEVAPLIDLDTGRSQKVSWTIPMPLAQICHQALKHKPEARFQSMRKLADALRHWLDGSERLQKAEQLMQIVRELDVGIGHALDLEHTAMQELDEVIAQHKREDRAWNCWKTAEEARQTERRLTHKLEHQLYKVLLLAPEYHAAGRRLMGILLKAYRQALMQMNLQRAEQLKAQMDLYSEALSSSEKSHLNRQLKLAERLLGAYRHRGAMVGRQALCLNIAEALKAHRWVSLVGPAGVGKTMLSLEVSKSRQDDVCWVSMAMAQTNQQIIGQLGEALGLELGSEPLEQLSEALASRGSFLLVIDNLEQAIQSIESILQPLLETAPQLRVLMTSRRAANSSAEHVRHIPPLSVSEALHLFQLRAQNHHASFQIQEKEWSAMVETVQLLDQLPLAIELAAARIPMVSIAELKGQLQMTQGKLGGLQKALQTSWVLLEPWEQDVLIQMAAFRGPFSLKAASQILSMASAPEGHFILDVLQEFVQHSFVTQVQSENELYFDVLVSIREFLDLKWTSELRDTSWRDLCERHAVYYAEQSLRTLWTEELDASPHNTHLWVDEIENLRAVATRSQGYWSLICGLGVAYASRSRGSIQLGLQLVDAVLEEKYPCSFMRLMLEFYRLRLLVDISDLDLVGERFDKLDDDIKVLKSKSSLPDHTLLNGHFDLNGGAEDWSDKELLALLQFHLLLLRARHAEGLAQYEPAMKLCQEASAVAQSNGLLKPFVRSECLLSKVQQNLGLLDDADAVLTRSLSLCQKHGFAILKIQVLRRMALVYRLMRRLDDAYHSICEAAVFLKALPWIDRIYSITSTMGMVLMDLERYDEALEYYARSLKMAQESGKLRLASVDLGNMANVHYRRFNMAEAVANYVEAAELCRRTNDRRGLCINLGNIGNAYMGMGDFDKAEKYCKEGIQLAKEISDVFHEAVYLGNLGGIYRYSAQFEAAQTAFEASIELAKRHNIQYLSAVFGGNLASLYFRMGDKDKAHELYSEALPQCEKVSPSIAALYGTEFAHIHALNGDEDGALNILEKYEPSIIKGSQEEAFFASVAARVYAAISQQDAAERALKRALELKKKYGGDGNAVLSINIQESVRYLTGVLRQTGKEA